MDWREMFARYGALVMTYEGTSFLYTPDWTPEEWAAISELWPHAEELWGQFKPTHDNAGRGRAGG